ncbi:hypothetical protein FACS1894211_00230 [Clostridia bacterium]|nr:hypothetical protein FACS1894211_00230 [Clostridia bacterium]
MKKRLLAILLTLVLFVGNIALTGCKKSEPDDPPDETPVVIPAVDRHIKLNDTGFNFLADMPQGTTVDTSAVNFGTSGAYNIVYKLANAEDVTKKAYVYGMPNLMRGSAALTDAVYPLSYRVANALNFLSPFDFDVTAKDSFGNDLTVIAAMAPLYDREYGDYDVTYSATDLAGNEALVTATYSVSGENQQTIGDFSVDLGDDGQGLLFSWADVEDFGVRIDGVTVPSSYYTIGGAGITLSTDVFNLNGLQQKNNYSVRILTDIWCEDVTATVTDTQTPQFIAKGKDYIFQQAASASLPFAEKLTAQRFTLQYEVTGGQGGSYTATEVNNAVKITKVGDGDLETGIYTIAVKAYRGNTLAVTKSFEITVCTVAEYDKILAAMTSDQFKAVYDNSFAIAPGVTVQQGFTFDFDAVVGAYRYNLQESQVTSGNYDWNKFFVEIGGSLRTSYNAKRETSEYIAIDIYYNDSKSAGVLENLVFFMQAETTANTSGQDLKGLLNAPVRVYAADDINKTSLSHAQMVKETWYTVVLYAGNPAVGLGANYNNKIGFVTLFSSAQERNLAFADIYIKNIRFTEKPGNMLYNNYICLEGDFVALPFDSVNNIEYAVTAPDGTTTFTVQSGVGFEVAQTGVYTAEFGESGTLCFTAYTQVDYDKIIAPMTSGQHDNAFAVADAGLIAGTTFGLQESGPYAGSYRYQVPYETSIVTWTDHMIEIGGDLRTKYDAGKAPKNQYIAIDIRYNDSKFKGGSAGTELENLTFKIVKEGGAATSLQDMNGINGAPILIYATEDPNKTPVSFNALRSEALGVWYTVILHAGAVATVANAKLGFSVSYPWPAYRPYGFADISMKNFRFTELNLPSTVMIASMTSAEPAGSFTFAGTPWEGVAFGYDSDKGAYRYYIPHNTTNAVSVWGTDVLYVEFTGGLRAMYNAGRTAYKKIAIDICYNDTKGGEKTGDGGIGLGLENLAFSIVPSGASVEKYYSLREHSVAPAWISPVIYATGDANKTPLIIAEMQLNTWYTIEMYAGGSSTGFGSAYNAKIGFTALYTWNRANVFMDLCMKNLRFIQDV